MLNSHTIFTAVGFASTENKNDFLLFDHTMEVLTYTNCESKERPLRKRYYCSVYMYGKLAFMILK